MSRLNNEFSPHTILRAVKQGVNANFARRNFSDEIMLIKGCVALIDALMKDVEALNTNNKPILANKHVADKPIQTKKPIIAADYIEELMLKEGKPLTVSNICKKIFKLGYKTNSKFPYETIRSSMDRDYRFFKCDNYKWYIKKS